MIKVTLLPTRLLVGEVADLLVQLKNTDPGTCTQIIFTLKLPREILLLDGQERIVLDRLEPGETSTRSFRVQPLSAGRCLVTSANFSYRDRYGAPRRVPGFRAELVTAVPEHRDTASQGHQPAAEVHPSAAEAALSADFVTAELPHGKWTSLEGRLTNSGGVGLVNVELSITGPLTVEKRGRRVSLGTVPPNTSVEFAFSVCADRSAGSLPIYLDVSFVDRGRRCTRELVKTVRVGRGHPPPPARDQEPVVLFFGANPVNTEPLRIDKEFQVIADALEEGTGGIRIKIHPSLAAGADNISRELLRRKPWIVHFAGHGGGAAESFAAERDDGYAHIIPPEGLAQLLETAGEGVECVIINACSTEGLAEELFRHVNYVIAMSRPIEDWCAIEFSKGFYRALAAGYPIKAAFKLGIAQLKMASEGADYEIPLFLEPSTTKPSSGPAAG